MLIRRRAARKIAPWVVCAVAPLAFALGSASAEPRPPTPSPTVDLKALKETELRGVEDTIKASDDQRRKIEAEVEAIKVDRARLNAALVDTTAKVQEAEATGAKMEMRLTELRKRMAEVSASLDSRREAVGVALTALMRLGANPPPAILVKPDDMAAAVRASMTISGAVPQLQSEIQSAAHDLQEFETLRVALAKQRDDMAATAQSLAVGREKLARLVDARQQSLSEAQSALDAERKRATDLANQALTLKDLIARMEAQIPGAKAGAQAAAAADGQPVASPTDSARLKPAIAFVDTKGALAMPVIGQIRKNFGDPDDYGGVEKGLSIATPTKSTVSTPVDGWIVYAGPYRSYGQLLILNAGAGYYLVMAGMDRTNVAVGQFVLAGEAVATMGDGGSRTAAAAAIGAVEPVLYIELRKNETPIDPGPWWAKTNNEKAHG